MATLTLDLIRKKAEHHTDTLSSLQELSLHQINLAHLTPILSQACPHLRILYLHNNLLSSHPTFKQLHRLKSLTYLNLTLNNITHLPHPHLAALEKLTKLDLTLNHIGVGGLEGSLVALEGCERLNELYLTGNPCMKWEGCRLWVVGRLAGLQRLDGKEVTRSERLEAARERPQLAVELQHEVDNELKEEQERQLKHSHDSSSSGSEEKDTRFTPELRMRMYEEQQAMEAKQAAEASASASKFTAPVDLYTAAQNKLNTFLDPADYSATHLPSQRNVGRYTFTMAEAAGCVVLRVVLPRHMDTSGVRVDVQPWWVQVDVRGQLMVLHTGVEVAVGAGVSVRRVVSDGSLVVKMPVVRKEEVKVGREEKDGAVNEEEEMEARAEKKEQVVVVKGSGKSSRQAQSDSKGAERDATTAVDKGTTETAGLKEVSATRSVTLEAKRQMEQEAIKQRGVVKNVEVQTVVDDDDDVPPLI